MTKSATAMVERIHLHMRLDGGSAYSVPTLFLRALTRHTRPCTWRFGFAQSSNGGPVL